MDGDGCSDSGASSTRNRSPDPRSQRPPSKSSLKKREAEERRRKKQEDQEERRRNKQEAGKKKRQEDRDKRDAYWRGLAGGSAPKAQPSASAACEADPVAATIAPVSCSGAEDSIPEGPRVTSKPANQTAAAHEETVAEGAVAQKSAGAPQRVRCLQCKLFVDPWSSGVRRRSKTPETWICATCNCKVALLYRMFGTWPIMEFDQCLDEDGQAEFFRSCGSDSKVLATKVVECLTKRMVSQKKEGCRGRFLPLKVWEKLGWDPVLIEQNTKPEDKEMHPQGGMTYRIDVHEIEHSKLEETIRTKLLKLMKHPPWKSARQSKKSASDSSDDDSDNSSDDGSNSDNSDDSDDSDNSDDSSASPPRNKKKKHNLKSKKKKEKKRKHKKEKRKHKKEKEKDQKEKRREAERREKEKKRKQEKKDLEERRQEEREARKRRAETAAVCMKTVSKTSPLIAKLETHFQNPNIKDVPKAVHAESRNALAKVKEMETAAKKNMLGDSAISFDMDDVADACKEGDQAAKALCDFLSTIERNGSKH